MPNIGKIIEWIQCKSKTVVMMASLTWQTPYLWVESMLWHRYILFSSKFLTDYPCCCGGFSTHEVSRIPSHWGKSSSRQLPLRLDSGKVHTYATLIPAITVAATANTPSPPFHLLTMILFAIATPKIILTVPSRIRKILFLCQSHFTLDPQQPERQWLFLNPP